MAKLSGTCHLSTQGAGPPPSQGEHEVLEGGAARIVFSEDDRGLKRL